MKASRNRYRRFFTRPAFLAVLLCGLLATTAWTCQVPVFRYALERWPADRYEVIVLHSGPLNALEKSRFDKLSAASVDAAMMTNIAARAMDVAGLSDDPLKQLWKTHSKGGGAVIATLYPRNAREVPDRLAHVADFSDDAIESLLDSPVRQALIEKIVSGDSAVWIFIPSGDTERDATALKTLQSEIKTQAAEIKLPPQEEIEADEFYQPHTQIELRVGFSILTLDRQDPREKLLLQLLLNSESDLQSAPEPLAFPVLGRGRVLYALVGKGIMPETIGMASRFVVGPCSCQVKEQNPGFDLLLSVDWDAKIGLPSTPAAAAEPQEPVLLAIPPGR